MNIRNLIPLIVTGIAQEIASLVGGNVVNAGALATELLAVVNKHVPAVK